MPEFRLGKIRFQFGDKDETRPNTLSRSAHRWQQERESLWDEATVDPNVYAIRQNCPHSCGWWTMAVSDLMQPDIANMEISVDTSRHIAHDCQCASHRARSRMEPKPSH